MKKMNIVRSASNRGFTLIELLVVIAIIGILSSVVLVSLNSARSKGTNARIQEEVNQLRTQFESDFNSTNYPDLIASSNNIDSLSTSLVSTTTIQSLVSDINNLNGSSNGAALNSAASKKSGITIYSTATSNNPNDYSIYAMLNGGVGYFCASSGGNTITNTTAAALPTSVSSDSVCE